MINFRKKAVAMLLATVFTAGMLSGCGASGDIEKSKNDSRKAVEQTTQAEADTDRKSQNEEDESDSRDIFAMDTYMTLTAYGKNARKALDEAVDEITILNSLFLRELTAVKFRRLIRMEKVLSQKQPGI